MKQFIIALRSSDFLKAGKSWSTEAIDLYHNKWYTNYSSVRSRYGLDLIGDRTFVGTEVIDDATPTINVLGETPISVTNYGEVVKDPNVITYNTFTYDELSGEYLIFNLIESSSPYYILNSSSVDEALYRFVDTSSEVDILSYKRSIYKRINSRFSYLPS
jgi:hypothetical protein